MLVLSRKADEGITVNGPCEIRILKITGNQIKIGIEAPQSTTIIRTELVGTPRKEKTPA